MTEEPCRPILLMDIEFHLCHIGYIANIQTMQQRQNEYSSL